MRWVVHRINYETNHFTIQIQRTIVSRDEDEILFSCSIALSSCRELATFFFGIREGILSHTTRESFL